MKRNLSLFFTLALTLALAACGAPAGQSDPTPDGGGSVSTPLEASGQPEASTQTENPETPSEDGGKILIAYFSATNNTEGIANHLDAILDADLYEIVPEAPYTSDDLNYNDSSSRSSREMDDPNARPAISGGVEDMEQYGVIFLGYPIWWGEAPRIINTFLESYDLNGKTIVPFCTSASSPLGSSATKLQDSTDGATWLEGRRFSGGASEGDVQSWVNGLGLTPVEDLSSE